MSLLLEEFAAQVERQPQAIAVAEPGSEQTFAEVDAGSDRLAHLLHDRRQSDNDINGYLGPISIQSVTANLACFKAGQCIAALDPRHPVPVLADLIRHSGMARLLVGPGQEQLAAALADTGVPQVPLSADTPDRAEIPVFTPVEAHPESLSTIVYTSGSTGRPKGSVNPRRFFLDRWERNRASAFRPDDVGASFWTFRWEDQLRMLCDGVRQECFDFGRLGPVALAQWINERRVTNFVSYMFLFRQMCGAAEALPHIRRIFLLGEPIVRSDLELFNEKFSPGAELISRFGSSEYGAMTVFPYRHGDPIAHDVLPIGKPIHAGTLFLLDEQGEEVPQGELGEVTFSTPLVPRGYHNDPERSAKVFMPDHKRPGHWRYHTGDLGFLDGNGDVTVVGRKDEQVKVRGYTVRPHEVEQMLVEHPAVALAGVVPFTGRHGNMQIAAFFQPASGAAVPDAAALRAYLSDRAPGFMVPSAFLPLAEMPLSPNGKVARGRLPDPLSLLEESVPAQDLASTATEKELVRIWSKVLGHGQFTLADDFFDMGGDSLQAMSMVTEIEAALKIKVPFESLMLDGASIAVLAHRIDEAQQHGAASYITELKRGSKSRPALFAAHVIGGHLSDYLEVVTGLHGDRAVFGIHPRGMAGEEEPDFSMQALARHSVAEMRKVQPDGPYHLLGYSFGARLCVEIAHQLVTAGQTVGSLVMIDPQPPNGEPGARSRAIHRPLREGSVTLAMLRLLNTVPASMGIRGAPRKIDEAHLVASLAFRPQPLLLPRVMILFASGNPYLDIAKREWQRVFGGNAAISVEEGSHTEIVRAAAGQAMGRKIEAWLGEAVAAPEPAAAETVSGSRQMAG